MMRYICLMYDDQEEFAKFSEADRKEAYAMFDALTDELRESGHYVAVGELGMARNATLVRVRDGKIHTTDGPFAETKEQLAGYYIIEAKNSDEAIAVAARIPGGPTGAVEVRALVT